MTLSKQLDGIQIKNLRSKRNTTPVKRLCTSKNHISILKVPQKKSHINTRGTELDILLNRTKGQDFTYRASNPNITELTKHNLLKKITMFRKLKP